MLSLSALRLLHELRNRGTLTAAAEALHLSRSAASHQLAALQRAAGVALTEKVGRTLRFTEAGLMLAGHAERVLRELEEAGTVAERAHGSPSGVIRLGAVQTIASSVLPSVLTDLHAEHPRLRVEAWHVSTEHALAAVPAGELDLAVISSYDSAPVLVPPGTHAEILFHDPVRLVLPVTHRLARRAGVVPIAELAGEQWISGEPGSYFGRLVPALCRRAGFTPDIRHRTGDYAVLAAFVTAGHGVACVPAIADLSHWSEVVTVAIDAEDAGRDIVALNRESSRGRPAVQAVLTALRRYRVPA
ncbi:LysR substrate-binding domain-containing protein [Crossiella sp. CA198]|uniref:LysR family transcriptional regulator n=1 Tax=Crossiella sp. CA198 TaxID=3455607 RepID=UPI003F8D763F